MINSLKNDGIHVCMVNLHDYYNDELYFYDLLSEDERARSVQIFSRTHEKNFILTRGILRRIIGDYLEIDPRKIKFSYGKYGKPFLYNPMKKNELYFSVSHSGNIFLCAFSKNSELGVDVEKIEHLEYFELIAEDFFYAGEILSFKKIPFLKRREYFFKHWTRKEAFIKMIGYGLCCPMNQFELSLLPKTPPTLCYIHSDFNVVREPVLKDLNGYPGYAAALAFEGPSGNRNIQFLKYQDMQLV